MAKGRNVMKKLITIGFIILISFTLSWAETDEKIEKCKSVAGVAELIMQGRQAGIEMEALITIVQTGEDANANKVIKLMIIEAYDSPRYSTPEYIRRAMIDFKNKWFLFCYK